MTRAMSENLLLGAIYQGRQNDTLLIGIRTPSAQNLLTHRLMHIVVDTVKWVWQESLMVEFQVISSVPRD